LILFVGGIFKGLGLALLVAVAIAWLMTPNRL